MKGLVDGPKAKGRARRRLQAPAGSTVAGLPVVLNRQSNKGTRAKGFSSSLKEPSTSSNKQRFGLPKDFLPRGQRPGRTILLEGNIYRLPDGREFVPCHPTGALGSVRHVYALVTPDQYQSDQRSSIYVRTDGRIFDYSVDSVDATRELFDTGYTMNDLERTGRYVSKLG